MSLSPDQAAALLASGSISQDTYNQVVPPAAVSANPPPLPPVNQTGPGNLLPPPAPAPIPNGQHAAPTGFGAALPATPAPQNVTQAISALPLPQQTTPAAPATPAPVTNGLFNKPTAPTSATPPTASGVGPDGKPLDWSGLVGRPAGGAARPAGSAVSPADQRMLEESKKIDAQALYNQGKAEDTANLNAQKSVSQQNALGNAQQTEADTAKQNLDQVQTNRAVLTTKYNNLADQSKRDIDALDAQDPTHKSVYANQSTGAKIAGGIAMALGAIGAGLSKTGVNQGLEAINKGIDTDVADQRENLKSKMGRINEMSKQNAEGFNRDQALNDAEYKTKMDLYNVALKKLANQGASIDANSSTGQNLAKLQAGLEDKKTEIQTNQVNTQHQVDSAQEVRQARMNAAGAGAGAAQAKEIREQAAKFVSESKGQMTDDQAFARASKLVTGKSTGVDEGKSWQETKPGNTEAQDKADARNVVLPDGSKAVAADPASATDYRKKQSAIEAWNKGAQEIADIRAKHGGGAIETFSPADAARVKAIRGDMFNDYTEAKGFTRAPSDTEQKLIEGNIPNLDFGYGADATSQRALDFGKQEQESIQKNLLKDNPGDKKAADDKALKEHLASMGLK